MVRLDGVFALFLVHSTEKKIGPKIDPSIVVPPLGILGGGEWVGGRGSKRRIFGLLWHKVDASFGT